MLCGAGQAKNIVCPLHNWAYDLDGCQLAAPHFAENPGLDLERTELAEWNGLLFAGPRDVQHELAPLDELDGARLRATTCWSGWMRKSTTSIGRCSSKFISKITTSARCIQGSACSSTRPDLRGAFQAVGGDRFFCEQVNVRWPLPPAATPNFAAYQRVLMDVLAGRRPPFAAIWMCLFSGAACRIVSVHDGRHDVHAAIAHAHAAAERVLLRPRNRGNSPRLRGDGLGRARRGDWRRPRGVGDSCKTAGRLCSTAARISRAPIRCRWSRGCATSTTACVRSLKTLCRQFETPFRGS